MHKATYAIPMYKRKNFIDNKYNENNNKCNYSTKNKENKQMNLNRYTIIELSDEVYKKSCRYSDNEMFEKFKEIVESHTNIILNIQLE